MESRQVHVPDDEAIFCQRVCLIKSLVQVCCINLRSQDIIFINKQVASEVVAVSGLSGKAK